MNVNPIIHISGLGNGEGTLTTLLGSHLNLYTDDDPPLPSAFPRPIRPGMSMPPLRIVPTQEVMSLTMRILQDEGFAEDECSAAYSALALGGGYDHSEFISMLTSVDEKRREAIWDVYMFANSVQGDREESDDETVA